MLADLQTGEPIALASPFTQVEIFELDLTAPANLSDDWRVLAPSEQARSGRFRRPPDRAAYIRCRSALRRLLGARLGTSPAAVAILVDDHSKPHLAPPAALHFNVSHTLHAALFAISTNAPVGVDLERIDPGFPSLDTARSYFHPTEVARLDTAPANQRSREFFAMWSAKEALAKAHGTGLLHPLSGLVIADEVATLDGIRYQIRPVAPHAHDHSAAVATRG